MYLYISKTPAPPQPLIEAQAWRRESNGDIVLVASSLQEYCPVPNHHRNAWVIRAYR